LAARGRLSARRLFVFGRRLPETFPAWPRQSVCKLLEQLTLLAFLLLPQASGPWRASRLREDLMTETRTSALPAGEATGAVRALDELYQRYRGPVLNYLYQLSGSADTAEELGQETFIKACAGLPGFRGDCSVSTWLFRIARNTYLDSLRRPSPTRIDTDELLAIPDSAGYADPARSYAAAEQRGLIGLALAQLPERQRTILLLRDDEGLAYAEIADVLGISLAAVKINLFRARAAFRAAYAALDVS
jgi:RNA polymerase sigma-70 factor (ECF subfamily)